MKKATTATKAKKRASRKTAARVSRPNNKTADWRSQTLARVRTLIKEADPMVIEEAKWKKPSNPSGVPTWSHDGILCTGETYKDKVKLTFARGAALKDPSGLFNSSLEAGTRRAIDIHEGGKINEKAFKALIREAVALNTTKQGDSPVRSKKRAKRV